MTRREAAGSSDTPFDRLSKRLGREFPAIVKARQSASQELSKLAELAANGTGQSKEAASSPDTSIVMFGSLARREWTAGSDVDWTLLIDSPGDLLHQAAAQEYGRRLREAGYRDPGPERVFGGLSFSHDLIHWIGGERDTNANMTRRLLLLLESVAVARTEVHVRVLRNILHRYIDAERSFLADTGREFKVPRFLLNDVVRYWRTIAVDYAAKRWERGEEGWALRNMKLRFSRKLLFAAGMLLCFGCYLDESRRGEHPLFRDQEEAKRKVHQHLAQKLGVAPLDMLCETFRARGKPSTAAKILSAYNEFLAALDSERRDHLKRLSADESYGDAVFRKLRKHSHEFQEGLTALFYDDDETLRKLTIRYGVF